MHKLRVFSFCLLRFAPTPKVLSLLKVVNCMCSGSSPSCHNEYIVLLFKITLDFLWYLIACMHFGGEGWPILGIAPGPPTTLICPCLPEFSLDPALPYCLEFEASCLIVKACYPVLHSSIQILCHASLAFSSTAI